MEVLFRPKHTIVSHTAAVYSVCAGRHSHSIFSASGDKFIAEWNVDTGQQEPLAVRLTQPVFAITHIEEEGLLVAGGANGTIEVIDIVHKKELHNFSLHSKGVYDFYFDAAGEQLMALGGDGVLSVWSIPDFRLLHKIQLSNGKLRQIAFSEQYGLYAIASADGNVYLLKRDSMHIQRVIAAHHQGATSVAWHPTKPVLLSGGRDALLKVWNMTADYDLLMELPAHNYAIYSIVFNESNTHLATGSRDKTIKVWNSSTMDVLQRIDVKIGGHSHSVNKLIWKGDALISVGDDRKIIVWEKQ